MPFRCLYIINTVKSNTAGTTTELFSSVSSGTRAAVTKRCFYNKPMPSAALNEVTRERYMRYMYTRRYANPPKRCKWFHGELKDDRVLLQWQRCSVYPLHARFRNSFKCLLTSSFPVCSSVLFVFISQYPSDSLRHVHRLPRLGRKIGLKKKTIHRSGHARALVCPTANNIRAQLSQCYGLINYSLQFYREMSKNFFAC